MAPTRQELQDKYFPVLLPPGVPNWDDTLVIPHVDGQEYFNAIADALDACQGTGDIIYITGWYFDPSMPLRSTPGSPSLEDILIGKSQAGADVRAIIAAPRYSFGIEGMSPTDTSFWLALAGATAGAELASIIQQNIRAVRELRTRGGTQLGQKVLLDWSGRNDSRHEKVTIVYNNALNELRVFVGGIDYQQDRKADELHTNGRWWHDAGVELLGGAAAAVNANFTTRWMETTTLPPQSYMLDGVTEQFNPTTSLNPPWLASGIPKPLPNTVAPGQYLNAGVRSIRSYDLVRAVNEWYDPTYLDWSTLPAAGVQETLNVLLQAIGAASTYVYIEDQTVNPGGALERLYNQHKNIFPALKDACARGVKVILVTSGFNGPDATVKATLDLSPEIQNRILSQLAPAQRDNFAAYYVRDTKVHSKITLIDDEFALIGSANMWDRSMTGFESEVGVAIVHEGQSVSLVADLRVRLWRGHMRVEQTPAVDDDLRDTSKSFGIWRNSWGAGVGFPYPYNALSELT